MGDMRPLLAEIFSMMEEVEKEVGVEAAPPSTPAPLPPPQPWLSESVDIEWVPVDTADIMPAAVAADGCSGSLDMSGKKGLAPARALLDSARATGMLLGSA